MKEALISFFLFEAKFSCTLAQHLFRSISAMHQVLFAINRVYCLNEKKATLRNESFTVAPSDYRKKFAKRRQFTLERAIYLITGVMASGKSTVSELLASKLDKGVHLRGDVFRRMIVSGREEMSAEPTEEAVRQLYLRYDMAASVAKTYYDNGFSVVIQDNYYGEALSYMTKQLQDYPVQVVVLCPNVEVVKKREESRGKIGYTGFSVETLYAAFLKETPKIGFWLNTSDQSPEQSVHDILLYFGK